MREGENRSLTSSLSPHLGTANFTMIFALALSICACFTFAPGIASQEFLDNNPELRDYQDEEECFPFNETWYEVYRNFESDPYFGGNGTCIRTTETGPYTNGSTTAIAQFSPNVS
ncbi:hypothetical protein V5799_012813, partial [Amblyomma americanum]